MAVAGFRAGADVPGGPADAGVRHVVRLPGRGQAKCGPAVDSGGRERPVLDQGLHVAACPSKTLTKELDRLDLEGIMVLCPKTSHRLTRQRPLHHRMASTVSCVEA